MKDPRHPQWFRLLCPSLLLQGPAGTSFQSEIFTPSKADLDRAASLVEKATRELEVVKSQRFQKVENFCSTRGVGCPLHQPVDL